MQNQPNPYAICPIRCNLQVLQIKCSMFFLLETQKTPQQKLQCFVTFFQSLRSAAEEVKSCKDSRRRIVLREQLGDLNFDLEETPTPVPLSLGFEAKGIDVENSAYFPSNSYPIKVAFSARVTNKVRFALAHFVNRHSIDCCSAGFSRMRTLPTEKTANLIPCSTQFTRLATISGRTSLRCRPSGSLTSCGSGPAWTCGS